MLNVHMIQFLLGILVGLVLGLTVPGLWHSHRWVAGEHLPGTRDSVLLALLVLAAFALGVFITYVLGGF